MMNVRVRIPLAMALLATLGLAVPAVCSTEFPIGNTANDESSISAAFDGTNFLVSYQERFAVGGTTGAKLVSPAGAVLATVSEGTGDAARIAFDGTNYLLA